jgi:hypothetical protein
MTQLRQYTNRKLCAAISRTDDDASAELLFGIKMVLMNMEKLKLQIDQATQQTPAKARDKTFKKVLMGWLNRSTQTAFNAWKASLIQVCKQSPPLIQVYSHTHPETLLDGCMYHLQMLPCLRECDVPGR